MDSQTRDGCTPLHAAAHQGHADVVKQLLAARCNVHLQMKDGLNAQQVASLRGQAAIATLISAAAAAAAAAGPADAAAAGGREGGREKGRGGGGPSSRQNMDFVGEYGKQSQEFVQELLQKVQQLGGAEVKQIQDLDTSYLLALLVQTYKQKKSAAARRRRGQNQHPAADPRPRYVLVYLLY